MQRRVAALLVGLLMTTATPAMSAPSPSPADQRGGVAVVAGPKSTHANPGRTAIRVGAIAVGRDFTETAVVVNTTARPVDVYLYPADGTPARGGGYAYATRGTAMKAVGSWLTLSSGRLIVPAGARVPLTVRLQVPPTATNGLQVGAVVLEPVGQGTGAAFTTITRYAMPVSMTVTGGRPVTAASPTAIGRGPAPAGGPIEVSDLQPHARGSKVCPTVRITNNSTAPVSRRVRVTSDGWFGGGGRTTTVGPVASGASEDVQLPCVRRPIGPGRLRIHAEDASVGAHLFWAPLPLVFSLLLLLLLIAALVTTFVRGWLRQRAEQDAPIAAGPSTKEPDGNHPQ